MTTPSPEYRVIVLRNGSEAKISPHRYAEISKKRWSAEWSASTKSWYACRRQKINGKNKTIYMHREILGFVPNDGKIGDHIDHDTLNNCDENLREVTQQQNTWNSRKKSTNKSGFKGVSFCKTTKRWIAHISLSGKTKNLGRYVTPELAHNAYCSAAQRFYGDFRCLK